MKTFKMTGAAIGGMAIVKLDNATTVKDVVKGLEDQKQIILDTNQFVFTVNGSPLELNDTLPNANAYMVELSEKNPDSGQNL